MKRDIFFRTKLIAGFTIMEVLVVIAIIGVLTAVVLPSISQTRAKNRDTEKIADLAVIQLGLSSYYNQNRVYPPDLPTLVSEKLVPLDATVSPVSDNLYIYVPLERSGYTNCTFYHLGVKLELPNPQIDPANTFTSVDGNNITNGYQYCAGATVGIDGSKPMETLMYHVHP